MRKTPEDVEKFCKNPDDAKITGKIFADLRYLPVCPKCAFDSITSFPTLSTPGVAFCPVLH